MISWFAAIDRSALNRAGGKGANLGELVRAGLPVPPGFVIEASLYREHLEQAALAERIAARLAGLDHADLAAVEQACTEIGGWITGAPLSAQAVAAISAAYAELTAQAHSPRVAVRSSATAEDLPDASFAGQQETFLNLQGTEAVLDAVRRCWASLWAPRAVAYRLRMGYDHLAVDLAVIVQAMVEAEVAGVLFTANPLSGAPDEFLITAAYGLGEAVVSGLVTPDTFLLHSDGRIKERSLGRKEQRILPAGDTTRTEPVEPALQGAFCLSETDLGRLVELGRAVTAHYGAPQDIEWALCAGQLSLLQARPITVQPLGYVGPKLSRLELHLHALGADNNLDHWPEPLKPLDGAIYRVATFGLGQMMNEMGAKILPDRRYYEELPDGRVAIRPLAPTPRVPMLWRAPRRMLRALREDPGSAWPRLKADLMAVLAPLEEADLTTFERTALAEAIERMLAALQRALPERFSSMFMPGMLFEGLVGLFSRLALGKAAGAEGARHLFMALPYRSALMNRAIASLAGVAAKHGQDSPTFAEQLAAFLAEWGSRPTRGMEALPSIPAWQEEPGVVLGMVQAMLTDPTLLAVDHLEHQQAAQFTAAQERISARLNPLFRRWFTHSLAMARRFIMVREESLQIHERACAQIRRCAQELGRRLTDVGHLKSPDEIFYLFETELGAAARGELALQERIDRRRRAYARILQAHQRGENWLIASGSLPPEAFPRRNPPGNALLKGIPTSGGRVTGRVRIIREQSEFGRLQKGEILVAPLTAPAWTPLFGVAAAVVTDVGGALSHAAIVAREYGIPAVLGASQATRLLQDGQLITVDGTTGLIYGE